MTGRIAFAFLMLSLLSATPSIAAAEPATDETRAGMCEEFTGVAYGSVNLKTTVSPYYRVTVRSSGPKNTVSFVQVIYD